MPAEVRDFQYQYEIFGCWVLLVRRNGLRTCFQFDGKDEYLAAQRVQPDAGDFSKRPRGLGGIALPGGLNQESFIVVLQFIRSAAIHPKPLLLKTSRLGEPQALQFIACGSRQV